MGTYCAFLRALNVGNRTVRMERLRGVLADAGFDDVETYIQSGNARFTSRLRSTEAVEVAVERALWAALAFEVPAFARTPGQLAAVLADEPASPLGPQSRHYVMFLRAEPSPDAAQAAAEWAVDGERLQVVGRELHIWLEKPSHQAKATNARLEKLLGVDGTTRDAKVVTALAIRWGSGPVR